MDDSSYSDEDWTPTIGDVMEAYVHVPIQTAVASSRAPAAPAKKSTGNRRAPNPLVQDASQDGNSENVDPNQGTRARRPISKTSGAASRNVAGATTGAKKQRVATKAPAAKASNRNRRRIPRESGATAPTRQPSNNLAKQHKWKGWPSHWLQVGVRRLKGNKDHVDYYYYPPHQGQPDWDARSGIVCRSFPDVFKYLRSQRSGTSD